MTIFFTGYMAAWGIACLTAIYLMKGVIFGFMEPGWPEPTDTPVFSRIFWFAMPFMVLAAMMIVPFVI